MTTSIPAERVTELSARMSELMPGVRADLEALSRIPSVSLSSFDPAHVRTSAEATAELLRGEGMQVELVDEGGHPAVIGRIPAPEGAPTVLLYAHHDVQPPGEDDEWDSPAFEPTERDGRLYGRGVADDKAGILAHVAAVRALGPNPGVGITIFVEGEEEVGSDSLPAILERHAEALRCDAIILADSANWAVGTPSLTTTLRGMCRVVVECRTLNHGLHSGMFGGPCPDGITTLCRLLSTLHDDDGNVAVAGLEGREGSDLEMTEEQLRADAGLLPGVKVTGTGSLVSRLWTRPALTVIGMDTPSVDKSANLLTPSARAKLSVRLAPGQNPREAYAAICKHLEEHNDWGAELTFTLDDEGDGFDARTDGPMYGQARASLQDAWGVEPVDVGIGGSIPFVAAFADTFPEAEILVTGIEDPDTRAHAANESLHLAEFEKACLAEALFLERLAAASR